MNDRHYALKRDAEDPLKSFRNAFYHNPNEIYLDGNSLGKLPLRAQEKVGEALTEEWGKTLIGSWNAHWLDRPKRIASKYAKLLHLNSEEIILGESTSVRLYQVIHALLHCDQFPKHLGTDSLQFPSDLYILEGIAKNESLEMSILSYSQETHAEVELLKKTIQDKPGIYCLSLVSYKSGYRYPLKKLNQWASKHNSIIVWDFSHAVGAISIDCKATETLVAVGCTYKYMNGGPGSPAFLYVNKKLISSLSNPIKGWFGHRFPFSFSSQFDPSQSIERFGAGTPSILSLTAVEAGVDLILEAGMLSIEQKSKAQSDYFISLIETELLPLGFSIETPSHRQERGSHVSISHKAAWPICLALQDEKVQGVKIIPDFRPPHFIRFGITPLYTRYVDLWDTVQKLIFIVTSNTFKNYSDQQPIVP